MIRRAVALVAAFCPLGAALAAGPFPAPAPADLILRGAEVWTPGGWVGALAIRDGLIVATGDASSVERWRGGATRVIDLDGGAVFPGLHDTHVHSLFAGLEQFRCAFRAGASPRTILETVKGCAAKAAAGDWIEGGNWVGAVFDPGEQTRAALDAVAPQHPVLLSDEAHHSVWVNSRALALAGISRDTPDPPGGIIERDSRGEPTGVLRENAADLVERVVPEASPALKREALLRSTGQMLSFGITSFTDASVRANNLAALVSLAREGLLQQRVRGCLVWAPGNTEAEAFIRDRTLNTAGRFRTDCVKIFIDGVPIESRTAAMLAPYEGAAHDGDRGMLMIPQMQLEAAVADFDRQGLHIKFHAVGDAGVRAALDAVAHARAVNGWGGSMHESGHSTFVDPADIGRVRDLQMAWEFSPYIWFPTPITDTDIRRAVGVTRLERAWPVREAIDTGALVTAGSDWSVVPSVNPWLAMETLVTRQAPGGQGNPIGRQEGITLQEALRLFTENGARLMGQRDRVGSLEPGMEADLVVTASNPFRVPIGEVHRTSVRMTFIAGQKVYDSADTP